MIPGLRGPSNGWMRRCRATKEGGRREGGRRVGGGREGRQLCVEAKNWRHVLCTARARRAATVRQCSGARTANRTGTRDGGKGRSLGLWWGRLGSSSGRRRRAGRGRRRGLISAGGERPAGTTARWSRAACGGVYARGLRDGYWVACHSERRVAAGAWAVSAVDGRLGSVGWRWTWRVRSGRVRTPTSEELLSGRLRAGSIPPAGRSRPGQDGSRAESPMLCG